MQEPHREVHALDRDLKLGSRMSWKRETAIRAAVNLQLHAADRSFALLILHDFLRRHLEELFAAFLMRRKYASAGPVGPGFRLVFVLRGSEPTSIR